MTPERWQQVEALYHAVRARPVDARASFLVEACRGDEALRREVESLLAQPVSAEGMLDRPAADAVPMTSDIAGDGALAGRRLGAYLFQKRIGAGGMGEVYRAQDMKLRRDVAIKILPRAFTNDPDRLARFEREGRVLASLNHPNIGAIYGLEELDPSAGSGQALVLELVEGETLAERIRCGPIPLAEALPIARQIADALEAAHEQGIVHRDLKPANIKVRADGTVKVLDFGLAKAMEPAAGSSPSVSQSPTIAPAMTEAGMILGTAAYMSPEQARGRTVDRRADVWAFGAVLFEMLTGKRAFRGATVPDTMVAILEREPDWNSLPAATPVSIRRLLERCLTKEPKRRLRDIGDAALDLAPPGPADRPRGASRPDRRAWIATTVLSLALVAALIPAVRSRPAPAVDPGLPLESVFLTSTHGRELEPALARDGQRVTYVWDGPQGDNFDLYTKVIGAEVALRLTTHPAHDGSPAWSPDGRWIAFIRVEGSRGTLFLVPSTGGPERKLREVSPWFGSSISFSPDGRWIAISERPAPAMPFGVVLLATETRETRILTRPDPSFAGDAFPAFSPDGQTLAFARVPRVGETLSWANIFVAPVSGGEGRALARVGRVVGGVGWTRDGREILFSANHRGEGPQLWRVPMTGGDPTRALADEFSFSDVVGAETLTQVSRFFRFSVAFGADRLAYSQSQYQTDIWQFDLASARPRAPRPYAASTQIDEAPQFSPDGRHIAFASTRGSKRPQIWVCDAAGSGCAQITRFNSACGTPRWSPDSQRLAFDSGETGQPEIFVVEVATGVWRQFTSDKATDVVPAWSRNGSSIYFASDRNGAFQVWRMAVAGGPAVQVTTKGGFAAFESPDGRDLYFTQYEKPGLWAMPAQGGPERYVLDQPACWGYWALAPHGVYVLDSAGSSGPRIALHRWGATGVEDVANVPAAPACGESGLTLSPDGGTLLYVGTARESDIVMIDHFR